MWDRPLDDAEIDRLSELLDALPSDDAMSLEAVDGFFSALICAPRALPMGVAMELVWGAESGGEPGFAGADEVNEFMGLAMRHWNAISAGLATSKNSDPEISHVLLLFVDNAGIAREAMKGPAGSGAACGEPARGVALLRGATARAGCATAAWTPHHRARRVQGRPQRALPLRQWP